MDYKAVLEEQIRELQKVQDKKIRDISYSDLCDYSLTILEIIKQLERM